MAQLFPIQAQKVYFFPEIDGVKFFSKKNKPNNKKQKAKKTKKT